MEEKNKKNIGALWVQESKKGKKYMAGKIGNLRIVIFKNTYKKPDSNEPDYLVYERQEKPIKKVGAVIVDPEDDGLPIEI